MAEVTERVRSVGLCLDCRFAEVVRSARGAIFYRCRRSETDPGFPKYPRLPVITCTGHERATPAKDAATIAGDSQP